MRPHSKWAPPTGGQLSSRGTHEALPPAVTQVRAADHRHHGGQHLGPVPAGAAAGLRPGGDPPVLLERLQTRTPAHQDLLQGLQADDGEGGCGGEPGRRHGGQRGGEK